MAIIKLKDPIELNIFNQVACLPEENSSQSKEKAYYLVGFADTYSLMETVTNYQVEILPNSECEKVEVNKTKNWENQFCVGKKNLPKF